MKKLFLIIGAPGSGKTTDASIIAENNSDTMAHYSTGDMLRAEVASGSNLGKTINGYIKNGDLVPLKIIIDTIISAINGSDKEVVLIDGYPRSVEQMTAFDTLLEKQSGIDLRSVIEVRVSEEVARQRIIGRAEEAEVARDDDSIEVFQNRMKVYADPLAEIQKFYTDKKLLKVISGERSIEEVVAEMESFVKSAS
jgi:adenylate kinase